MQCIYTIHAFLFRDNPTPPSTTKLCKHHPALLLLVLGANRDIKSSYIFFLKLTQLITNTVYIQFIDNYKVFIYSLHTLTIWTAKLVPHLADKYICYGQERKKKTKTSFLPQITSGT